MFGIDCKADQFQPVNVRPELDGALKIFEPGCLAGAGCCATSEHEIGNPDLSQQFARSKTFFGLIDEAEFWNVEQDWQRS